jgi:hypothetical protein
MRVAAHFGHFEGKSCPEKSMFIPSPCCWVLKANMQTVPKQFNAQYLPLEQVTRPNLTTAETAYYLNRRPQTLRGWACLENGPLRPTRIGGLLAWNTATVKTLVGVTA